MLRIHKHASHAAHAIARVVNSVLARKTESSSCNPEDREQLKPQADPMPGAHWSAHCPATKVSEQMYTESWAPPVSTRLRSGLSESAYTPLKCPWYCLMTCRPANRAHTCA